MLAKDREKDSCDKKGGVHVGEHERIRYVRQGWARLWDTKARQKTNVGDLDLRLSVSLSIAPSFIFQPPITTEFLSL